MVCQRIPNIFLGKCLVLRLEDQLKSTLLEILEVTLRIPNDGEDNNINVIVHNEGHFVPSMVVSDSAVPHQIVTYNPRGSRFYDFGIALQKRTNLNTPERPCVEDPDYLFDACLQEFEWRHLGCVTVWSQQVTFGKSNVG